MRGNEQRISSNGARNKQRMMIAYRILYKRFAALCSKQIMEFAAFRHDAYTEGASTKHSTRVRGVNKEGNVVRAADASSPTPQQCPTEGSRCPSAGF